MTSGYAAITKLRKFIAGPVERCDFCRVRVPDEHAHLVEARTLRMFCACAGCAAEMTDDGLGFRRIEQRQESLAGFQMADSDWAMLQIPIDVAFLFRPEDGAEPIAMFPGPAGATRSQLSADVWSELAERYPVLGELAPGAEALLVNRSSGRRDHYRVSTDHCYALTGLMRARWRGLTGGEEAWAAIDQYFTELDHATTPGGVAHA
ncbi:DUF5947+protein [Methylocapsa aurea]|uniref:DUF5947 family protein n=1 Tax=Methylocapsa aurea TaxID=663610 RepID=UPI003D18DDAA